MDENPVDWPELAEPHAGALRDAVASIVSRSEPPGIVVAGSILRVTSGPSSHVDVYVVNRLPERQRIQRRFRGVPVEMFVNPP
jgi:hypothetical protein